MTFYRYWLLCFWLVSGWAHAHNLGTSYSQWQLSESGASVTARISQLQLSRLQLDPRYTEQYAEKVSFQVPYNGTNDFYNEERLKTSKLDFSDGLTKGLEIAKEAFKWAEPNGWHRHEVDGDTWFHFQTMEVKTTSELITIFLTEKYGK